MQIMSGAQLHEITKEAVEAVVGEGTAKEFDPVAFGRLQAIVNYAIAKYISEKGYDYTNVKAFFIRSKKGKEQITFWTHELTDYKHLANQMAIMMQLDDDDEIEEISRISAGSMEKIPGDKNIYAVGQIMSQGIARIKWDENFDEWLANWQKEKESEETSS